MNTTSYAVVLGASIASYLMLGEAKAGSRVITLSGQTAQTNAAKIIAVHIRNQGYFCWDALRAEKDSERSLADKVVWLLDCQNATYRVRLIPDMAAKVERLD